MTYRNYRFKIFIKILFTCCNRNSHDRMKHRVVSQPGKQLYYRCMHHMIMITKITKLCLCFTVFHLVDKTTDLYNECNRK